MALATPHLYLVCYDICGDKADRRLRRVYKVMRGYGEHIQYSIFRCLLTDRQLASLEDALDREIDHRQDQILIVPLGVVEGWRGYTLGLSMDSPERIVRIV